MPEISSRAAVFCLRSGPVGIGEDHEEEAGRKLALELIRLQPKAVNALFLEEPDYSQNDINRLITRVNESDYELALCGEISKLDLNYPGNPTKLGAVAAAAGRAGIPVYVGDRKTWGTSDRDLNARDYLVAEKFRKITTEKGSNVGFLVLYGAAHFTRDSECLSQLLPNLNYVICRS